MLILGLKYYLDNSENTEEISFGYKNLMNLAIILLFGLSIIKCNKTSLVAIIAATTLFVAVNYYLNIKFYISEILKDKRFGIIFGFLFIGVLLFVAAKFNILEIIYKKIEGTYASVFGGGISSYSIRTSNWKYFLDYWSSKLDVFNLFFGFGMGKSREIMFYISKSQFSPIYIVQTTHNNYMEMFFDYGATAILYFAPMLIIFFNNLSNLLNKQTRRDIKLISNLSMCLLLFYFIYHLADGLRVPTAIIFFGVLMLLEGIKFTLNKLDLEESKYADRTL